MKEYNLINKEKYKLKIVLNEKEFDYYTDIMIELIYDGKHIMLFKDNLLALKNIVEGYEKEIYNLDDTLDEKGLGLLLNEYYRCSYEEKFEGNIVLDNHGHWLGEKYCLFNSPSYATWLYTSLGNIIMKVTPLFGGFEEDDYMQEYGLFIEKYEDTFKEIVCLEELKNIKKIILELYNEFLLV